MQIKQNMHSVYERQASCFDERRDKTLFEKPWLDRFLASLPKGGSILDLGCGSGEPIARHLIDQEFKVTGVDFSTAMIAIAKKRWPELNWTVADMREWQNNEKFDGVIAWNSLFHLSPKEQRNTLPSLLTCVKEQGAFLTTAGPKEGATDGKVGGELVYHGCLSEAEYRKILTDCGFNKIEFKPDDPECRGHTILFASKAGE